MAPAELDCLEAEGSAPGPGSRDGGADGRERQWLWAAAYEEEQRLPPTHRLASRPWLSRKFERLPMVVCQKTGRRKREARRKSLEAREAFLAHLRNAYGNDVRAWRRGLDPEGELAVSLPALRHYCSRVNLRLDIGALWKSLDQDCDGTFGLQELCLPTAMALAGFKKWATAAHGSCAALWDHPETAKACVRTQQGSAKAWVSDKKILLVAFADALKQLGWAGDAAARSTLLSSLDYYGCGFMSRSDLEWLDLWQPPEWLCAEPDLKAWMEIRALLLEVYEHPLRAWRSLLDRDDSNQISWAEFQAACKQLQFTGNVSGAWRAVDSKLSGSISMAEYDPASAELLSSFKQFAETNYGSVELAFKAFDSDGNGLLTHSELKKACQRAKWPGDVRLLFNCLDVDGRRERKGDLSASGKRSISFEHVAFLDTWEPGDAFGPARNSIACSSSEAPLPPAASSQASRRVSVENPPCLPDSGSSHVEEGSASKAGAAAAVAPDWEKLARTYLARPQEQVSANQLRRIVWGPRRRADRAGSRSGSQPARGAGARCQRRGQNLPRALSCGALGELRAKSAPVLE